MTRASGYYWVKMDGEWSPAYWNESGRDPDPTDTFWAGYWDVIGYEGPVEDSYVCEVGARLE